MDINYKHIIENIKEAFINQGLFSGNKKIIEFFDNEGKFQGDIYNFFIKEYLSSSESRFYVITSPYDVNWKSAPQQALVFEKEKLIDSFDFSPYVNIRTGAMDAIFLQSIGITSLKNKKILIVGSGSTAKYSYLFLKNSFSELGDFYYTNTSGPNLDFEKLGELKYIKNPDLSQYDMIFLHANVEKPYLTQDNINSLKKGVILTSYGGKAPERDIDSSFFSTKNTIFVDMISNIESLKPLQTAINNGNIKETDVIDFGKHLKDKKDILNNKNIIIFISGGTYIQNLAMIKYLMKK